MIRKYLFISSLYYDHRFMTDFKKKSEFFDSLFSEQRSLISYNSPLLSQIKYATEESLSTVALSVEDIGKIIQNLDSNIANCHNNVNIRMLNVCGDSIYKPLEIIFRQALLIGVVPIHTRSDQKNIKQLLDASNNRFIIPKKQIPVSRSLNKKTCRMDYF